MVDFFQNIIQKIKDSNSFFILAFLVLVISYILTVSQGFATVGNFYERTLGRKAIALKTLNKLSADTNIGYFISLLGNPVFINTVTNEEGAKFKEYIFVDKFYYVQAIINNEESVLVYSITTRDKDFNPKLKLGDFEITLGKTKFNELKNEPLKIISWLGAHDFFYSEEYYFGNPANYQTFIFGLNEAGYLGIEYSEDSHFKVPPDMYGKDIQTTTPEIKSFREEGIINTYTITKPLLANFKNKDGSIDLPFTVYGPSYNQVRILPK